MQNRWLTCAHFRQFAVLSHAEASSKQRVLLSTAYLLLALLLTSA